MPTSKHQQWSAPTTGENLEGLHLQHHSFKLGAFLHSGWTVSSFPGLHAAPWDRNLRLAQNTTPVPVANRARALSSVELHEGKAGHLNWWLGCHTCIFPACYKATQLRQVPGCARHLGWRDPLQESP